MKHLLLIGLLALAGAGPATKPGDDLAVAASRVAVDVSTEMAVVPPSDATTADKERSDKEREAKVTSILTSLNNKVYSFSGTVEDVLPSEKFPGVFPDSPIVAILSFEIAPSEKTAIKWGREMKELTASWDRKIRNDPKNADLKTERYEAIERMKQDHHFATLRVWIGGREEDFKGWKKQQEKKAVIRIEKTTGTFKEKTLEEIGVIGVPASIEK